MGVETIALVGLGLSAAGTAFSVYQGNQAAKDQKKAMKAQQRASDLKAARERVQAVREARIRRASVVASAGQTGTGMSSGVAGGTGSIQSQLGGNLNFSLGQQALGREATSANISAAGHQADANMWSAVAGLGGSLIGNSQQVSSLFSPSPVSNNLYSFSGTGKPMSSTSMRTIFNG